MIRTGRRVRLEWRAHACVTLACATFALLMTACGGGGGGGTAPPVQGGGSTPESTYLLAEFVAGDSNNQFVRVWDPAHPDVAVQNVRLVQSNGIVWQASHLVFSDATTYDAATRSVTTLGHAKVFYDNGGHLYSIDLRGGQPHAPVQLSSVADAFLPTQATALDGAGTDAWIDVQGGSHHWAIRSTMSAADAPLDVLKILAPLRDAATGRPQYFFVSLGGQAGTAVRPTTFEIVDTAFTVRDVAPVATMGNGDGWIGVDPATPGLAYLRIDDQLRALHWGADVASVTVDAASLHAFASPAASLSASDAQSLYFSDGIALLKVANGMPGSVGQLSAFPTSLTDAGGYVAAVETVGIIGTQPRFQIETLRKSDGALTLLEDATTTLQLLAASDLGLVMSGTSEQGQSFVVASGDNASRTTLAGQWVGVVRAASAHVDQPAPPLAVLSCVAGATGYCAAGALSQQALSGGVSVALGTLAAATARVRGDGIAGVTASLGGQTLLSSVGGFGDDETDRRDAWQFTPGTAASLARATSNLP